MLSNHDVVRETTRYGGGPQGVARAKAAALTMLALPGSAYVYQGEELGLEQVDVPPELRQDPAYHRGGDPVGRDGCRVPMPWAGTEAPYAFGPTPPGSGSGQPWLPMPADWAGLTVEAQQADEDSTLSFFKRMLRLRREVRAGLPDQVEVLSTAPGHVRLHPGRPGLRGQLRLAPLPAARRRGRAADQQRGRPGRRPDRPRHRGLVPHRELRDVSGRDIGTS